MINESNKKRIFVKNLRSKFFLKANRAFVSMIALLLANVFLVIGLSVFNIALREIILSSGAKDSLFAFYAADGGMECALYWDIRQNIFSTTESPSSINCSGQDAVVTATACGDDCRQNTFNLTYPSGACVEVEVFKLDEVHTRINSFGMNTCDSSNLRRVERAWRVNY